VSADVAIEEWLRGLGFALPGSLARARAVLEEAGFTRAGKTRISNEKLDGAEAALKARLFLHCTQAACTQRAKFSGREAVPCEPSTTCEVCGGSANKRAEDDLVAAFARAGASKLVVVGGSPAVREELERGIGQRLELRMIDGTERRTVDRAKADLEWADLVLLWGGTELHHKVSMQYTNVTDPKLRRKMVHIPKRGVAALLQGAIEHFSKKP
jgi:hypothetical protein